MLGPPGRQRGPQLGRGRHSTGWGWRPAHGGRGWPKRPLFDTAPNQGGAAEACCSLLKCFKSGMSGFGSGKCSPPLPRGRRQWYCPNFHWKESCFIPCQLGFLGMKLSCVLPEVRSWKVRRGEAFKQPNSPKHKKLSQPWRNRWNFDPVWQQGNESLTTSALFFRG